MRTLSKRTQGVSHYSRLQQGQVILVTLLLLGIVASISLFSLIRPRDPALQDGVRTEQALAQAKQALINYASGRATTNRPGELPCPDRNNNGSAEANCNTVANRIGRFPWSTLGVADLRDGSGERLWYALSNNFKNSTAVTPLNSNTPGQLTVTGISPASGVIAIVFAPGPALAGQTRSAANLNSVAHYLEGENANGDTIFTTAVSNGTFNDRLFAITPTMFFPQVEMRVAREIRFFLNAYFSNQGYFPFASAYGSAGLCTASGQGRIPGSPQDCNAAHAAWGGATPQPWFTANGWNQIMFYAVAPACTDHTATNCAGAGGLLAVNGVGSVRAVTISPGAAYTGQSRPCASITDCMEPPNTTSFPAFTHSTGSDTTNDRVFIVAP